MPATTSWLAKSEKDGNPVWHFSLLRKTAKAELVLGKINRQDAKEDTK